MTFPRVAFVSSPDLGADVRFDFNTAGEWADGENWPEHDDFSLGVPSLSGDYDAIGVEYGPRELTFNLVIKARKATATATMSALARELLRQRNWLLFQVSPFSRPAWFRTYRTEPGAISFEYLNDTDDSRGNLWGLGVSVDADSFAYGERVTLDPITVVNSPADATHPMWFTLPDVLGDAPTPLRLRVDPTGTTDAWFFRRRGVHMMVTHADAAPVRVQTSAMTAVSPAFKQTILGGEFLDGDAIKATMPTGAMVKLTTAAPNIPFGRYRMLLRAQGRNDSPTAADSASFWLGYDIDSLPIRRAFDFRPTSDFSGSFEHFLWLNMGEIDHPLGGSLDDGTGTLKLVLWGSRIAGGSFAEYQWDEILLVPIDDDEPGTMALIQHGKYNDDLDTLDHAWVYDGETDATYLLVDDATVTAYPAVTVSGSLPVAIPGRTNRVVLDLGAAIPGLMDSAADSIAATTQVTVSYQPRWLYMAAT